MSMHPNNKCPWCGARESSLGSRSKPSGWRKYTCATVDDRFGRLCPKRPRFGPKTYSQARAVELYAAVLEKSMAVLRESHVDLAFVAGDRWPVKIGDTIQFRKPARYLPA